MDKDTELQMKIFIAQELEKGSSLSDIQNMVNEKFSAKMTYMDIRIMASTLDVDWRALDPNAAKETPAEENSTADSAADAGETESAEEIAGEEDEASAGNAISRGQSDRQTWHDVFRFSNFCFRFDRGLVCG